MSRAEKPILFRDPLVVAIMEDRKTQTRRLVKDQAAARAGEIVTPYAKPGDILHVREAHSIGKIEGIDNWIQYAPGCGFDYDDCDAVWYRATDTLHLAHGNADGNTATIGEAFDVRGFPRPKKWRPSIHQPEWAWRIALEVSACRVEPLNEITEADARAEGVTPCPYTADGPGEAPGGCMCRLQDGPALVHVCSFMSLWDEINGTKCPWSSNPMVHVVTFERRKK